MLDDTYIPELMSALLTIELALAIHAHKDRNGVIRKTARRLVHKQKALGKEYIRLLIASKQPYKHLNALKNNLRKLCTN